MLFRSIFAGSIRIPLDIAGSAVGLTRIQKSKFANSVEWEATPKNAAESFRGKS